MEFVRLSNINIGVNRVSPILFSHMRTVEKPEYGGFHLHDCLEIFVYAQGAADFLLGDRFYSLREGDVIFTLPNELHRPVIRDEALYERFYIQIPVNAFGSFDGCVRSPLARFLGAAADDRLIRADEQTRARILRLLAAIGGVAKEGGYLGYAYFLELLDCLDGTAPHTHTHTLSTLIERALRYVSDNLLTLGGVKEIAEGLHVHPAYLSSAFSRAMGTSLKQYVTYQRISVAKQLLRDGLSVTETAYRVGFGSSSHFIEVFRHIVGETPRQYLVSRE